MNHIVEITKSLNVISEMLGDRGIKTANLDRLCKTDVMSLVKSRNIFSIDASATNEETKVVIVYDLTPKFKWSVTKAYIDTITQDVDLVILVLRLAADIRKIGTLGDVDHQSFDIGELQFNRSTHVLVPKHELITDEATIAEILDKCQISKGTQLPIITKMDAMSKYLNAKPGNIVKITRISPTCGENIVYRFVA